MRPSRGARDGRSDDALTELPSMAVRGKTGKLRRFTPHISGEVRDSIGRDRGSGFAPPLRSKHARVCDHARFVTRWMKAASSCQ